MGRRSLADQFFEYYREEELDELVWLVLYDFEKMKSSGRFYDNLVRVMLFLIFLIFNLAVKISSSNNYSRL